MSPPGWLFVVVAGLLVFQAPAAAAADASAASASAAAAAAVVDPEGAAAASAGAAGDRNFVNTDAADDDDAGDDEAATDVRPGHDAVDGAESHQHQQQHQRKPDADDAAGQLSRRVGALRICGVGRGCRCSGRRPFECFDFTRDRRGVCETRTRRCVYCLLGRRLADRRRTVDFVSPASHRCVAGDTCARRSSNATAAPLTTTTTTTSVPVGGASDGDPGAAPSGSGANASAGSATGGDHLQVAAGGGVVDRVEMEDDMDVDEEEVECVDGRCVREGQPTEERCSCREGFVARRMWDGRVRCTDRNECETSNDCYRLHCINIEGGFRCGCLPGYRQYRDQWGRQRCRLADS